LKKRTEVSSASFVEEILHQPHDCIQILLRFNHNLFAIVREFQKSGEDIGRLPFFGILENEKEGIDKIGVDEFRQQF
jgi:hypothetical protein